MRTKRLFQIAAFTLILFLCLYSLVRLDEQVREGSAERAVRAVTPLIQVGSMYLAYCDERGKPPPNLRDFDPYRAGNEEGYQAVQRGELVVLWNTRFSSSPEVNASRIIAFERQVRTSSGRVLFANRSAASMTASEFESAMREQQHSAN